MNNFIAKMNNISPIEFDNVVIDNKTSNNNFSNNNQISFNNASYVSWDRPPGDKDGDVTMTDNTHFAFGEWNGNINFIKNIKITKPNKQDLINIDVTLQFGAYLLLIISKYCPSNNDNILMML